MLTNIKYYGIIILERKLKGSVANDKKTNKKVIQMTIIILVMYLIVSIIKFIGAGVLVMYLIASIIKFIGAGGQELIIRRATTAVIIYLIVDMSLTPSSTYDIINI